MRINFITVFPCVFDVIHNYKMVLFSIHDAGEDGFFRQFLKGDASAHGLEADIRTASQAVYIVVFAVVFSYHAKTGGSTVHCVGLVDERERLALLLKITSGLSHLLLLRFLCICFLQN